MNKYFLVIFMLITSGCIAQTSFNGSFEKIDPKTKLPEGWSLSFSKNQVAFFATKLDGLVKQNGKYSISLEKTGNEGEFGAIEYVIPNSFEGTSIELKGYLKTENVKTACGLWLRLDGDGGQNLGFDNMLKQGINGTNEWKQYSIKMPYTNGVKSIHFGGLLQGDGKVWFDNFALFIDGKPFEKALPVKISKAEADTSFSKSSLIKSIALNPQKIKNLMLAGQYWGFLKYHHPSIANGDYNWDAELFRLLPTILESKNDSALSNSLEVFLDKFAKPNICNSCKQEIKNQQIKPSYGDLLTGKILSESLTKKLEFIKNNRSNDANFWVGRAGAGNPEFKHEKAYANMLYPDAGYRLLSLYRYWSIINYFFPYKDIIDEDWNNVLKEFVPIFVNAKNEEEYTLATLKIIAKVQDTHANIWGANKTLENFKGKNATPFQAKFIENKLIVTGYYADTLGVKESVKIGDEIKLINGKKVEDLIKQYLPITPASNYDTQLRDLPGNYLLRANEKSLKLTIARDGNSTNIEVPTVGYRIIYKDIDYKKSTGYHLINDEIGYVYPAKYKNDDLPEIIKQFKNTKGIVVDMRCYPSNFMPFTFGNFIKSASTPFVKFTFFDPSNPGSFTQGSPLKNGGGYNSSTYKGKVVVIVNSTSQSQAEYTTIAFQSSPNVKVIGSKTAGADGNVSPFTLPGGISTMISGIGVFYPDGMPTQKVGVKIDYPVKPTLKGIAQGTDELLEKAVSILQKGW